MDDFLVINIGKGCQEEMAQAFAEKNKIPIWDKPGNGLTLVFDACGLSLSGYGMSYQGDFKNMLRRVTHGRLDHEILIRAAKSNKKELTAIDATAGMGEDSLLLAAYGYDVTLYEQNPIIAALLKDTIRRSENLPELKDIVSRMHLIEGNSISFLSAYQGSVDLVYLDPMFPERRKSGLVNKKLQLIQKLEPPCSSEIELFNAAIMANPSKIIVKRPLKSPNLAAHKPSYTLMGKAIRYDCYVIS